MSIKKLTLIAKYGFLFKRNKAESHNLSRTISTAAKITAKSMDL